jgi:hypothetical protein
MSSDRSGRVRGRPVQSEEAHRLFTLPAGTTSLAAINYKAAALVAVPRAGTWCTVCLKPRSSSMPGPRAFAQDLEIPAPDATRATAAARLGPK